MAYTATLIETNSEKIESYFSWGDSVRAAEDVLAGEQNGARMVLFGDCGLVGYEIRGGRLVRHEAKVVVDWDLLGELVR